MKTNTMPPGKEVLEVAEEAQVLEKNMKTNTLGCAKVLQVSEDEEQVLETALVSEDEEQVPKNMKTNTLGCGKVLQVAEDEKQVLETALVSEDEEHVLETALVKVFSEEVVGLTVREAGCKLMLRNVDNIISEGLPLSVQVRRAMLNSPYFVQMDNGKFVLWDHFLNSKVGRLDEEEITSSKTEKIMGIHNFDRDENCATDKEPAKELGQLDTNLENGLSKIIRTKGKRGRRAGLVVNMRQDEEKEEISICRQADGKMREFVYWDNSLNSKVGRLDEEEITNCKIEKEMGIHKFEREENFATYKEPAEDLGQLETKLENTLPKTFKTKGKRSRRAGLVMNMTEDEQKEEIGICRQADGKMRN